MFRSPRRCAFLRVECGFYPVGQLLCRTLAPVMEEEESWLLPNHVVVQRYDMNAGLPQRPEHRLHLFGRHDEIAVHHGQLVAAGKRGPGVQAHRLANSDLVHHALSTDAHFDHAVLGLALMAQDLIKDTRTDLSFPRRFSSEALGRRGLAGPDLLDRVPDA